MSSYLDLLIEETQKEFDLVGKEMNEYIQEMDFASAEALKNIYFEIKQKLNILKNLKNPDYDEIERLNYQINHIFENSGPEYIKEFREKLYDQLKEKSRKRLDALLSKSPKQHIDKDDLWLAIDNIIIEKKGQIQLQVKYLTIQIEANQIDSKLYLTLKSDREDLEIYYNNILTKEIIKDLNFKYEEKIIKNEFQINEDISTNKIMEIISCLVFEIFSFYGNKSGTLRIIK